MLVVLDLPEHFEVPMAKEKKLDECDIDVHHIIAASLRGSSRLRILRLLNSYSIRKGSEARSYLGGRSFAIFALVTSFTDSI
jgi:hypothetical protein